jgi:pimeloyl-ACP methyl ester carboxylesterase
VTRPAGTALRPYLHDTGDGPAVLLLHAFPLDASQWDHEVAALSGGYRCLRPDAFGCGQSPAPPEGMTLDGVAIAILGALDDCGISQVVVVGLSMGGYTAMALLRQAPQRIRALVLASTRATADADAARADRLTMAGTVRRDGVDGIVEPMVERLLAPRSRGEFHVSDPVRGRIRRCTPEGVAACQEAMAARPDSTATLTAVRVPTLLICGEEDSVTPPAEMREMSALIVGSRLELIAGAGHLSNLEQREHFDALLGAFLDELPAG